VLRGTTITYSARQQPIFDSRSDAGRQLSAKLGEYKGKPVVVLAIPNGGVLVGLQVASELNASFDLVISRKIPVPLTPESGFGAVADDGTVILNDDITRSAHLTRQQIEYEATKVRAEIKKRSMLYRGDRPLVTVGGKMVIVIDDGLASGITMRAAVESVRHRHPKEIVVAVPCASALAVKQVKKVADRVITVSTSYAPRFYVSDFYCQWYDISDEEVLKYLHRWRIRNLPHG